MTGRVLGLDYGTKRVGIAISDPSRQIAQPLEVVDRSQAVERVQTILEEFEVAICVVGLPTSLGGQEGAAATAAREFGRRIEEATGRTVVFVDERFTSATAERAMIEAGVKRRRRRETLDKFAATVILQTFLDRPQ